MNQKLRTIALNTFGSFLRDRLLVVFLAIFVCVILLMMTPLIALKAATNASNMTQAQGYVLELISMTIYVVSGCGSLLAVWLAADSVASEMKSGTILAVMARPVKRWQFLLGKYLGVMLMMTVYVVTMFGLSYLLAWMGGQRIQSTPWVLLAYPLVRYAIYASLGMAFVTLLHPVVTWGITLLLALLAGMVAPGEPLTNHKLQILKDVVYFILPSTNFLSEDRFLTIRDAALKQTSWMEHLTTLAYGADYAFVLLLLAMWSFHYRSLKRD
jgi:ABC-type transport system involved in multi-copper enzyme maturation permease subunit